MKKIYLLMTFIVVAMLPFIIGNSYYINIMTTFGVFAILALSLNFIVGYIGEISFGHAAFFGLGAYLSVLFSTNLEISYWAGVLMALPLVALVGMVVGFLSLRLQGVHFAIITLAFAEVFRLIILNMTSVTRGAMGISVSKPNIPFTDISLSNPTLFYYFVFLILIIIIFSIKYILSTPFGRGMIAIREGDLLSSSIGINVTKYKVITFTISTIIAALAGALYAPFIGVITPDLLSVHYTTEALLMVVVGGIGYLIGPLFGAFIFTVIPEFLWMTPEVQLLVFGVILLLAVLFMPKGIAYLLERIMKRFSVNKNTNNSLSGKKEE